MFGQPAKKTHKCVALTPSTMIASGAVAVAVAIVSATRVMVPISVSSTKWMTLPAQFV
jgi:D-serine deaminase-like pyridoxal phosphate-dependent protein